MKFYRLLDAIPWVRDSLERKLGFLLFIGSQITLLVYVGVKQLLGSPLEAGIVLIVASFNLGSWTAAYVAMRFFLEPVEATAHALRAHLERRPVEVLPQDGRDIIGQLMRDADYIGKRAEMDASELHRAIDDDLLTGLYSRRAGKRRLMEDVARSERRQMKFHFAFISLHGLSDIGTRHGNDKLDAMLQHVAGLFKMNSRRSDWVARWNEHLFAVGFCENSMIRETMARLHQILEESPFAVAPGEMRSPIAACGVCEHTPGLDLQTFYEMTRDAMRNAENALNASDRAGRVVVVIPEPILDPELKAILEK